MPVQPLLTVTADGAYELHPPTVEWLRSLPGEVRVVTCAGKFRCGKSYLLNRLLGKERAFGVGDTVQACTRGLWICTEPLVGADGRSVYLVDSEGIDALDVESEHDVKIFALAVLLSSTLVYNSMSHLDEAAVQTLSLMTKVAESVGEGRSDHHLYWVLRDFRLQLVDADGKRLSHSDYLERALEGKCATRDAIKRVFPTRHLVTLPRPQDDDKFDRFLRTWRAHLLDHAPPVTARGGVAMTGPVYVAYALDVVAKMNVAVPKLDDTWTLLTKVQHAEAETAVRRRLLAQAEADCPEGDEESVRTWIERAAGSLLDEAQWMQGGPDAEVAPRLVDETWDRVGAHRVCDVGAKAADAALDALPDAGGVHLLVPPPLGEAAYARRVLERVRDVWDAATECAMRERTLAHERALAELDIARTELEHARAVALDNEEEAPQEEERQPVVLLPQDDERVAEAEAKAAAAVQRADAVQAAMRDGLESLKQESLEQILAERAAKEEAFAQRDKATHEAAALSKECAALRDLVRDAQQGAVSVHTSFLEEVRRRDSESKELREEHRREYAEACARAEARAMEAKGLKRRLDEVMPSHVEVKRLRLDKARDDAVRESLTAQLTECRGQRDEARASNLDLETRFAVLDASHKLETCRKALT